MSESEIRFVVGENVRKIGLVMGLHTALGHLVVANNINLEVTLPVGINTERLKKGQIITLGKEVTSFGGATNAR